MDIIISGCWSLWDQRNDAIFNGNFPELRWCIINFKNFFSLNTHRAKPSLHEGMQSWLDTLWTLVLYLNSHHCTFGIVGSFPYCICVKKNLIQ
jgi:hypothetical protein